MLLRKFNVCLLFSWTLCITQAHGQALVKGLITDDTGNPLPFATVYVEGTTNGTTSNAEGRYQLTLKQGAHQIVAQYIGYERAAKSVSASATAPQEVNFQLKPETLVLREVIISASERDPARAIIRNAISMRKFYEKEVNAYSCEVYIKGLQRLDKKPNHLLGMAVTVDTGIVYFSESISKLKFEQPDKINETMISSRVSGNNNAFSYNMASDMLINLYNNSFFIEGLSERSFVSPISSNAFLYYDYKLAGTILEDSLLINKIKIIPKRDTDPVFSGYIYIIEDSWQIHSVDVFLTRSNGIEFIDSLTFVQIFAPADHGIRMPISQRFTFKFKAYGFQGSGHFTAIYKGYEIEPNYTLIRKEEKYKQVFAPEHEKKDLFGKKDFSKALLTVEEGANEKDTSYWNKVRPIPLTPLEIRDYRVKDSIRVVKESKPYKDSVDQIRNRFKPANLLLNGYTHFNSYREHYINFPTLLEGVQYNAVEGLVANLEFSIVKRKERMTRYQLIPGLRYGFENRELQARIRGYATLDQKKGEALFGGLGRYIYQFNESEPIKGFDNTWFTLIEGRNYARYYQKTFAEAGYQKELANGLHLVGVLSYDIREPMSNTASYNLRGREFQPNIPMNEEVTTDGADVKEFNKHQAFIGTIHLRYRFGQEYIDRPDRKINLQSKYPEVSLLYKTGLPVAGSDINYSLLKLGTEYSWRIGLMGTSQLSAWGGGFLQKKEMYFLDFQHFNGNRTYLRQLQGKNLFQVLDYYQFSTRERFVQAHYEHHFNEFIFNKIPLVKRLNLQAVASLNYLTTPTAGQYIELGGGIEHIFRFLRVDYYTAFREGHYYGSGVRIGTGF